MLYLLEGVCIRKTLVHLLYYKVPTNLQGHYPPIHITAIEHMSLEKTMDPFFNNFFPLSIGATPQSPPTIVYIAVSPQKKSPPELAEAKFIRLANNSECAFPEHVVLDKAPIGFAMCGITALLVRPSSSSNPP